MKILAKRSVFVLKSSPKVPAKLVKNFALVLVGFSRSWLHRLLLLSVYFHD